ncbi:N-acetylmuramoyl-L-alanine amidase family protein [Flavobacterium sp. HJJ]|uniref:N-acetylmuramoyl-L-alanine amidase family protein n=1 Tax=Flavobacterium sp. HJJ TaxID=2783792 RepID=UPI00397782DA
MKIAFTFLILLFVGNIYGQSNNFKVTLDAGHGDHDFGAVYSGRIEKNIALAIVLKVGRILESYPKVEVIYTRKTDVFIDLVERANIANRADSNIFVSIHCNANKNTAADGTETYVMGMNKIASNLEAAKKENAVITLEKDYKKKYEGFDPNSPETMIGMTLMQEEYLENSISLASKVEDAFALLGKKLRHGGVKQAPFMVLHKAYMPRVLVETGFISNPAEGDLLNSEQGQDDIAKAIANAIIGYKNEYFGDGGTETFEEKPSQILNENPVKTNETPGNN